MRGAIDPAMLGAILLTFSGFALAIAFGLLGAWSADKVGAFVGVCGGLMFSFIATAFFASR
jgi:hypothetical protein